MNSFYIAAGIVSVLGVVLAFLAAARCLNVPASLKSDEAARPYDETEYLWLLDGIY